MLVRIEPLKSFIAARSLLSSIGTTTILTRRAVASGFARKAVRRMRCTCPMCGSPAKRRAHHGRTTIRCAACQLPEAFLWELDQVLNNSADASGEPQAVWPEHELPVLVRASIPAHCWRQLSLGKLGELRYLTAEDIQRLTPWLTQLGGLLKAEANARTARIAAKFDQQRTKSGNGRPDEGD